MIYQYETRSIKDLEMSHGGHLVAVITNNLISQLRGHVGKIQQVIWCKNDSVLISCGIDGMIYIFNIFTGKNFEIKKNYFLIMLKN
jgi:WD40 repeat protein